MLRLAKSTNSVPLSSSGEINEMFASNREGNPEMGVKLWDSSPNDIIPSTS